MAQSVNKNICYFILFLLVIYNLQGVIYESGSIISQSIVFIYILICGFYVVKVALIRQVPVAIRMILWVFVVLTLSFIIDFLFSTQHTTFAGDVVSSFMTYKSICYTLLTPFPFYYFAKHNALSEKTIKVFFIAYFVVAVLNYYRNMLILEIEYRLDEDSIVNNMAYIFVCLLPYAGLFAKKWRSIGILFVCMCFILMGGKRGAIIVGAITIAVYLWFTVRQMWRQSSLKAIGLLSVVGFVFGYSAYRFIQDNSFLQDRFIRLSEGDSSGRDQIYSIIWNYWSESSNLFNSLFGYGFNSSIDIAGKFAHNDWLELLLCSGLVGVAMYLVMFISLYGYARKLNTNYKLILMMCVSVWLTRSFFSMGYVDMATALLMILIGYIIGKNNNETHPLHN